MTHTHAPNPDKLPLWTSVVEAYCLTWMNLRSLGRLSWFWLVVLLPVLALQYWVLWSFELASRDAVEFALTSLAMSPYLIEILAGASIAVAWHRRLLLGEGTQGVAYFRLDWTVVRYYGWSIILLIVAFLPLYLFMSLFDSAFPVDGSPGSEASAASPVQEGSELEDPDCLLCIALVVALGIGIGFPVVAILSYVPTRLSLILPAAALGHDQITVRKVWQRTRRTFWRLFLGGIMTAAPILILTVAFIGIVGTPDTPLQYIRNGSIESMIALLLGMVGVSYLSVAYRRLFGHQFQD